MRKYNLAGWMKPYNKFYFVKVADYRTRELDFERHQSTNPKGRRFFGWHNLEIFAIPGRERSKLYANVQESLCQYEAHRSLGVPNPVVYSYFTDVYCNGYAASLMVGCIAEAEYVASSFGAFLRAMQYRPGSRFSMAK